MLQDVLLDFHDIRGDFENNLMTIQNDDLQEKRTIPLEKTI